MREENSGEQQVAAGLRTAIRKAPYAYLIRLAQGGDMPSAHHCYRPDLDRKTPSLRKIIIRLVRDTWKSHLRLTQESFFDRVIQYSLWEPRPETRKGEFATPSREAGQRQVRRGPQKGANHEEGEARGGRGKKLCCADSNRLEIAGASTGPSTGECDMSGSTRG